MVNGTIVAALISSPPRSAKPVSSRRRLLFLERERVIRLKKVLLAGPTPVVRGRAGLAAGPTRAGTESSRPGSGHGSRGTSLAPLCPLPLVSTPVGPLATPPPT